MTPKLLLRIAAVLIFIHAAGHTLGITGWKQSPDVVQQQVIQQMSGHQFPFMGAVHSLADYYEGFGYACSIALFFIVALLWLVSADVSAGNPLAKKVVIAISYALLLWAVVEWIYFFPFATALTFAACLCSRWSLYLISRNKTQDV